MCVSIYLLLFVSNWIIYESSKTGTGPSHSNWTILHPQMCPMTNHGIVILQVDDITTGPTYQKPGKTVHSSFTFVVFRTDCYNSLGSA